MMNTSVIPLPFVIPAKAGTQSNQQFPERGLIIIGCHTSCGVFVGLGPGLRRDDGWVITLCVL